MPRNTKPEVQSSEESENNNSSLKLLKGGSSEKQMNDFVVGSGTFGVVYKVEDKNDPQFPLKIIKRNHNREYDFWGFISEFDILNLVNGNPHIVRLIRCCHINNLDIELPPCQIEPDPFCLILECGSSDLVDWIEDRRGIFTKHRYHRAKRLAFDLACGLHQLHKVGIMHRDMKLDNVIVVRECPKNCDLLSKQGCSDCVYRAKIIDFGAATYVSPIRLPCDVSTIDYQAPECWITSYYTEKIDIWAYAMILHSLLLGSRPYNVGNTTNREVILKKIIANRAGDDTEADIIRIFGRAYVRTYQQSSPLNTLRSLSKRYAEDIPIEELKAAADLVISCSRLDPNHRLGTDQILNHPWFSSIKDPIPLKLNRREEQIIRINNNQGRRLVISHVKRCLKKIEHDKAIIARTRSGDLLFNYRDVCHALRLWDILNASSEVANTDEDTAPRIFSLDEDSEDNDVDGCSKSKQRELEEPVLFYYLCLYIAIKFFSCLEGAVTFRSIYRSDEGDKALSRYEHIILNRYLRGRVYYPYIYEYCHDGHHNSDTSRLLLALELVMAGEVDGMLPSQIVAACK